MNLNLGNPKVSVIIPTYNRAHLIERAIQSVLDQTYQNFEIIVVDDGSTDNTEEVVKSFNSQKIRYLRCDKNKGAAAARNTGLEAARGDYMAFQDSDDEWLPDKLERQMEVFEHAPPEVGVVYTGGWRIIDNEKIYAPLFLGKKKEGDIHNELLAGKIERIATPVVVIRKECFNRVGTFDERLHRHIETELFLRISKYYEFKYIAEPLVIRYRTPVSLSEDLDADIEARKLILAKHFHGSGEGKKTLASKFFIWGDELCSCGKTAKGRKYFLGSFTTLPSNIRPLLFMFVSLGGSTFYNKVKKIYQKIKKNFSVTIIKKNYESQSRQPKG